jgi:uncharacterized membrane protein
MIAILAMPPPLFRLDTGTPPARINPNRRDSRMKSGRNAMRYPAAFVAAALVMGGLDTLWLSNTSGPLYHRALGEVMAKAPDMKAAIAFYLVYILGILWFAVRPALAAGDWRLALLHGGLFGFFAYATYDLTNLATLKVWSLKVSLIDMAWGAFLTAITASAATLVALRAPPA